MAASQNNFGPAQQGGFLRIMGIIYLVKMIRQRRRERRRYREDHDRIPGRDEAL
jgi:hypothetical protein